MEKFKDVATLTEKVDGIAKSADVLVRKDFFCVIKGLNLNISRSMKWKMNSIGGLKCFQTNINNNPCIT